MFLSPPCFHGGSRNFRATFRCKAGSASGPALQAATTTKGNCGSVFAEVWMRINCCASRNVTYELGEGNRIARTFWVLCHVTEYRSSYLTAQVT